MNAKIKKDRDILFENMMWDHALLQYISLALCSRTCFSTHTRVSRCVCAAAAAALSLITFDTHSSRVAESINKYSRLHRIVWIINSVWQIIRVLLYFRMLTVLDYDETKIWLRCHFLNFKIIIMIGLIHTYILCTV